MSTITQVPTNSAGTEFKNATKIELRYDATYGVTVNPDQVDKNSQMPIYFMNPDGDTVKVAFLSPTGQETEEVFDSQLCTITVGGFYHFNCYFTPRGATIPIKATVGGTLDVLPHKP